MIWMPLFISVGDHRRIDLTPPPQAVSSAGYTVDHVYTDCKIVLGSLA
jgi:hypothetical protein